MSKITDKQKKILTDFIVAQPNTQTPLAIMASVILDMNTNKEKIALLTEVLENDNLDDSAERDIKARLATLKKG